jgi:hypothetical protein
MINKVNYKKPAPPFWAVTLKLSGRWWLELAVDGSELAITAYFYPRGLWGRVYGFLTKPVPRLAIGALARGTVERARSAG